MERAEKKMRSVRERALSHAAGQGQPREARRKGEAHHVLGLERTTRSANDGEPA
jgi:hypothetical protein